MENKIFEEPVKIRYSDMDFNLVLKPSALLHFLQDLASDNAEALGFGYSYIIKHNLAWFLLKYHFEFEDYPAGVYNLNIKPEPRGYSKLFAFRDFVISSGDNILGRVASTWSLVNLSDKSMVSLPQVFDDNKYMKPFVKRENDLSYNKISPLQNVHIEKTFEVRYDDIDVNRHVNNANYLVWAFEPLDYEFRKIRKLKTLDIIFKKEVTFGSKISSQIEIRGNITNHILRNIQTNEDLCAISAEWIKK